MPELTEYLAEAPGALRVPRRRRQSMDISGKVSWRRWVFELEKMGWEEGRGMHNDPEEGMGRVLSQLGPA